MGRPTYDSVDYREGYTDGLEDARMPLRDAVIEAAKVWRRWRVGDGAFLVHTSEDELFEAVEALLEAERGE